MIMTMRVTSMGKANIIVGSNVRVIKLRVGSMTRSSTMLFCSDLALFKSVSLHLKL